MCACFNQGRPRVWDRHALSLHQCSIDPEQSPLAVTLVVPAPTQYNPVYR